MTAACIIPASREAVEVEKRKPLTRRETIELAVRQSGKCGCGCGVKLDALREGVTDEHVLALDHGGTNDMSNRSLWRTPCARKKTAEKDAPASAKIKRIQKRENGTRRPRKPIPSPAKPWPKGKTQWPKRGFQKRTDG